MVSRPAPGPVRAAGVLLAGTPVLGIVLTSYATWARNSVPAGVGPLSDALDRHDRALLRDSWVLHPERGIPLLGNLPALVWLGLAFLVFIPLAYYLQHGYPPARIVAFVFAGGMLGLSIVAVIADEDFADPDPGRLSPDAYRAWQDLLPPGYPAVHDTVLVVLIAVLFVACVLLDRPAARTFYRRHPASRRGRQVRARPARARPARNRPARARRPRRG
jgi:hypothetical protein